MYGAEPGVPYKEVSFIWRVLFWRFYCIMLLCGGYVAALC